MPKSVVCSCGIVLGYEKDEDISPNGNATFVNVNSEHGTIEIGCRCGAITEEKGKLFEGCCDYKE